MSGKELKEILRAEGINLAELAKALGFATDQRLHSALSAADVKSGLIEAIARVTNKTVGFFYGERGGAYVEGDGSNAQNGDNNEFNSTELFNKALDELAAQREQTTTVMNMLAEANKTISELTAQIIELTK